jgi:hypothetical protein
MDQAFQILLVDDCDEISGGDGNPEPSYRSEESIERSCEGVET